MIPSPQIYLVYLYVTEDVDVAMESLDVANQDEEDYHKLWVVWYQRQADLEAPTALQTDGREQAPPPGKHIPQRVLSKRVTPADLMWLASCERSSWVVAVRMPMFELKLN